MRTEIKEFETKVIEIMQRTDDVKSFRFAVSDDIDFKPGQFFMVTIKINGQEATKHFSFSNSPTEKGYVEFTKRITNSEFSQALDRLKVGDWARLKMPYGLFTFEGEYENIAFLAGGIGITPVRSICKYACDRKLSADMILIYGNKTERDIVFREDFLAMEAENKNMRIVYTVDNPIDKKTWNGRTGFITVEMIREDISDYSDRVFYICGPPKMVDYLSALLSEELKIPKERMKVEQFSGYI
ncbi:MAG: FAD-dependent oxidoreductase [Nitrospirae bacterium]|nr:FAD-dependent oxidoreductase [Nitrospirota bacterium]